jgi:hypothetical protein
MLMPRKNGYAVVPVSELVVTGFVPTPPPGPGSLWLAETLKTICTAACHAGTTRRESNH